MDPKDVMKQMMQFNKAAFDKAFDAMNILQEQSEKMIVSYMDQAPMLPAEGKKAIIDCFNAYKKGCLDFKTTVDKSYKKMEDFFASNDKSGKSA